MFLKYINEIEYEKNSLAKLNNSFDLLRLNVGFVFFPGTIMCNFSINDRLTEIEHDFQIIKTRFVHSN